MQSIIKSNEIVKSTYSFSFYVEHIHLYFFMFSVLSSSQKNCFLRVLAYDANFYTECKQIFNKSEKNV